MPYNDLNAAAVCARSLASEVATLRALIAKNFDPEVIQRSHKAVNKLYFTARDCIRAVAPELRCVRREAAHFGDMSAPTAHELTIEMLLAINRELEGIEIIGRKKIKDWPDCDLVLAEVELELTKAKLAREYLPARSPSEWAKALRVSHDTLNRYINSGKLRCDVVTPRRWRLLRADFIALGGVVDPQQR